ncbi:MAG: Nitrilase/cyanide hydratase and apolipoprotein N-acyltransferase, partial [uncultured Thermomicrobiales bacterium]
RCDGDQRARARPSLRHPLQRHRHLRRRRTAPRPAPQADPHLHRAPGLGPRRRQHPRRLRHHPRPGRRPRLLGALDAARPPRDARPRRADPRRPLADGAGHPPGRLPPLRLRGALLRRRRRLGPPPRPDPRRPGDLPERRPAPGHVPPRRRQRHRRPGRPLPGRTRRLRGDHPLRGPRPRPHRRRAPHLRRRRPLRAPGRLHPDRQHGPPDAPGSRQRGIRREWGV